MLNNIDLSESKEAYMRGLYQQLLNYCNKNLKNMVTGEKIPTDWEIVWYGGLKIIFTNIIRNEECSTYSSVHELLISLQATIFNELFFKNHKKMTDSGAICSINKTTLKIYNEIEDIVEKFFSLQIVEDKGEELNE